MRSNFDVTRGSETTTSSWLLVRTMLFFGGVLLFVSTLLVSYTKRSETTLASACILPTHASSAVSADAAETPASQVYFVGCGGFF